MRRDMIEVLATAAVVIATVAVVAGVAYGWGYHHGTERAIERMCEVRGIRVLAEGACR